MTRMDITIHASYLPHEDPEASLAFYRDVLGFEVRNDVGRYPRTDRVETAVSTTGASGDRP